MAGDLTAPVVTVVHMVQAVIHEATETVGAIATRAAETGGKGRAPLQGAWTLRATDTAGVHHTLPPDTTWEEATHIAGAAAMHDAHLCSVVIRPPKAAKS